MVQNFQEDSGKEQHLQGTMYTNAQVEFLDKPTTALDAKSENEIYQHFLRENEDKTIIFVTHRLSAVKYVDKILFFTKWQSSGL